MEYISYNNKLFIVKRIIKEQNFSLAEAIKEKYGYEQI